MLLMNIFGKPGATNSTMKFFVVLLILAINGAATKAQRDDASAGASDGGSSGPSYSYVIQAKRVEQVMPAYHSAVYLYYQPLPVQNITYYESITDYSPFYMQAFLINEDAGFQYSVDENNALNSCDDYEDGTWDYVIVSIVDKGILPRGNCPVYPGTYQIYQQVDSITVTFAEMINCGDYDLTVSLDYNGKWSANFNFVFTIDDDGTCISQ